MLREVSDKQTDTHRQTDDVTCVTNADVMKLEITKEEFTNEGITKINNDETTKRDQKKFYLIPRRNTKMIQEAPTRLMKLIPQRNQLDNQKNK